MPDDDAISSGDEFVGSTVQVDEQQPRQCSRCRAEFPVDPSLWFPQSHAWWLCPPCDEALLGATRRQPPRTSSGASTPPVDVTP
jgi:hypothetical protein